MGLFDSAAIGNAADGFYQGANDQVNLDNTKNAAAFQQRSRQEQINEWDREQQARQDIQNMPTTQQVDADGNPIDTSGTGGGSSSGTGQLTQTDANGNPLPDANGAAPAGQTAQIPVHQQLRNMAMAHLRAGNIDNYLKLTGNADELQMRDSASKVTQLISAAPGMSTVDVAKQAATIFNGDPFQQHVTGIQDDGQGGVNVTIQSPQGQSVQRHFANTNEITQGLMSLYNPQTYAQLQSERAKAAIELQKEVAKAQATPKEIHAGAKLYTGPGNPIIDNTHGFVPTGTVDADGNPVYARGIERIGPDGQPIAGGAGAGAGSRGGKPAPGTSPMFDADTQIDKLLTSQNGGVDGPTSAVARDNAHRLLAQYPSMDSSMAVRISVDAAQHPEKIKPRLNPESGAVDMVYNDGVNGPVVFNRGVATASALSNIPLTAIGVNPKDEANMTPQEKQAAREKWITGATTTMLSQLDPTQATQLRSAANDAQARVQMQQAMQAQAQQVIAQQTQGLSPQQAAQRRTAIEGALKTKLNSLNNTLDLVQRYGPKTQQTEAKRFGVGGVASAVTYASQFARGRGGVPVQRNAPNAAAQDLGVSQ